MAEEKTKLTNYRVPFVGHLNNRLLSHVYCIPHKQWQDARLTALVRCATTGKTMHVYFAETEDHRSGSFVLYEAGTYGKKLGPPQRAGARQFSIYPKDVEHWLRNVNRKEVSSGKI